MPERHPRTETWRAGVPVVVGPVTLLPIERTVLRSATGDNGAWFSASKEAYALVVRDAVGIRAIDTTAAPVSLAELRERIPELDALLGSL